VNADALYRILRALSTVGIVKERAERRFELTSLGKCLRTDHPQSMRFMAVYQSELNWPHWGSLDHSLLTGTNATAKVRGMNLFDYLGQNARHAEHFDRAMVNISRMEVNAVLAGYNFGKFQTIADIAGGYGAFLAEILKVNPGMRGILFDLPHVVKSSAEYMRRENLSDRVSIESGSFFETVPEGADAYMMKHIIHDWSDESSIKILRTIRNKMKQSARLLLVEAVVPPANVQDFSKFLDLEMLVATDGGRERTRAEFETLFQKAGFELERTTPTASMAYVIEAKPV
jgi:hypothetical protein